MLSGRLIQEHRPNKQRRLDLLRAFPKKIPTHPPSRDAGEGGKTSFTSQLKKRGGGKEENRQACLLPLVSGK